MEKWEYMSVALEWDSQEGQWKVSLPSSATSLRGINMGAALNVEGEQGWEVVGFSPIVFGYSNSDTWLDAARNITDRVVTQWSAQQYCVLLKRRKP